MTSRTHDMVAFASLITASVYFPPASLNLATLCTSLVGCVIGSLLPDMDQASNRLWDLTPGGDFTSRIFRRLFLGHRTLSHSLLGIYLVSAFLSWLLPILLNPAYVDPALVHSAIMIGFVSHLVADSFTEEGIPLFFPFLFKIGFPPIRSWRVKTGRWFETLVIYPGVLLYLFLLVRSFQPQIIGVLRLVTR